MKWMLRPCFLVFGLLIAYVGQAQTVIGMGTDSPNPHAVLELVPTQGNQGFLAPRLTSVQRTAASFVSILTDQDNGLLVFDTDEGNFYYWFEGTWHRGLTSGENPQAEPVLTGATWYAGTTAPTRGDALPGDFYLDQSTGDVYRLQDSPLGESAYQLVGNISPAPEATLSLPEKHVLVGNAADEPVPVVLSGDAVVEVSGTITTQGLQGRAVSPTAPTEGQVLTYNSGQWTPANLPPTGSGQWFSGPNDPTLATLPGAPNGSIYFNTTTQGFFVKEGGSWVRKGSLVNESTTPRTFTGDLPGGTKPDPALGRKGDIFIENDPDYDVYIKVTNTLWRRFID